MISYIDTFTKIKLLKEPIDIISHIDQLLSDEESLDHMNHLSEFSKSVNLWLCLDLVRLITE